MEKAYFPMQYYNLSQGYIDSSSHQGTYALDFSGKDTGKDPIYAPFSCTVTKLFVKSGSAYTVWLTSDQELMCAGGQKEVLTLMITHPEEIANLTLNQHFNQGDIVAYEGQTGNATGNHAHLELGIGKCSWHQNEFGIYTIDNAVKLEDYLMLKSDTIVLNTSYKNNDYVLKFEQETPELGYIIKYLTNDLNERIGPGVTYDIVNILYKDTAVKVYEVQNNFARIENNMWISNNFLTITKPVDHITSMEVVNTNSLNVRIQPNNGSIVGTIPVSTVVSVLATNGLWVKIGPQRWVFKEYLK